MNDWTSSLDKGYATDVIYFDFSKAFDSVPHVRLLSKLKAYGIDGPLLKWFKSFLVGRRQCVRITGTLSSWTQVKSGVPQGSILGPLLFTLYVNELPSLVSSSVVMFSDDIAAFIHLRIVFNFNMKLIYCCSGQRNGFYFNVSKCKILHISNTPYAGDYKLGHIYLELLDNMRILMDSKLKFHMYTDSVVNKVYHVLGLVKSFECKDPNTVRKLYKSLVCPIVEYANVIWGPH